LTQHKLTESTNHKCKLHGRSKHCVSGPARGVAKRIFICDVIFYHWVSSISLVPRPRKRAAWYSLYQCMGF